LQISFQAKQNSARWGKAGMKTHAPALFL